MTVTRLSGISPRGNFGFHHYPGICFTFRHYPGISATFRECPPNKSGWDKFGHLRTIIKRTLWPMRTLERLRRARTDAIVSAAELGGK